MGRAKIAFRISITIILLTMLISGPLFSGISLSEHPQMPQYGQGNAEVNKSKLPDQAVIRAADFGAANHILFVSPAIIHFESSVGFITVSYSIEIPEIEYERKLSMLFDNPSSKLTLVFGKDVIESEGIKQREYNATLSLSVRDSTELRTVATRNITVEVDE